MWRDQDQYLYALEEYSRYYVLQEGVDPDLMSFLLRLDVVEQGIHTVQGNNRYNLVGKMARDAVLNGTNFAKVKSYWYVENKDLWKDGPALKDLAAADLRREELYDLAPYIEFRVDYEIEALYGVTLEELIKLYNN